MFNSHIPTEIHLNFSLCDFCKIINRRTTITFGSLTDKLLRIITFWGNVSTLALALAAQDAHRPPACVRNHSCEAAQPVKSSYQQTFLIFSFCQFDFPCTVFMSRRRTNCPLGTNLVEVECFSFSVAIQVRQIHTQTRDERKEREKEKDNSAVMSVRLISETASIIIQICQCEAPRLQTNL